MKNLQSKIEETELPTEFPKPIVANGAHPDNATIAELAYLLWERRGCPDGCPEEDWFEAEQRLT